jgi:hypothetical protein
MARLKLIAIPWLFSIAEEGDVSVRKIIAVWLVAIALVGVDGRNIQAQERAYGAASFIRLGSSARATAMGRAYTALAAEDALGMFWNPASIAVGNRTRVSITDRVMGDSDLGMGGAGSFVSAGGSIPINRSMAVGMGIMYYGVNGIEEYDARARYVGDFSDSEMLLLLTLARNQSPIAVGVNLKYIRQAFSGLEQTAGGASVGGIGMDVGFLAHFWQPVRIGFMLRNKVDLENDRVPMSASVGVAYERRIALAGQVPRLVAGFDIEQVKDRPLRLHIGVGLERLIDYREVGFSLRVGRNNRMLEQRLGALLIEDFRGEVETEDLVGANARWGIGIGIERKNLALDYTFSRGQLHDPHYVSLSFEY